MGNLEGDFDTKLHEAVRYGDLEEVKVALQQGYDPNLIGLYQWSPLHEAAHNGEVEILRLLLNKKGDANKQDKIQGRTATHYAAEKGHLECLRALVNAGARYDIKDADDKTCLDLATPGGKKIFEKLRVRDLMLKMGEPADGDEKDEGIATDRSSVTTSRRSSLSSTSEKGPALGYIHLSVEYHSTKSSLKIRIWQLSDLLLPPPNTSMIHTIYVKSYLQPDKKRESKRKTEEVKVDSSGGYIHWGRKKQVSIQHVFTPAIFKFSRPLEYSGITAETVRDKHVQIEVCITQRYTHRSFLIGMLKMSLKSAVKKLVKEKLPLIPCMNYTIPSSMKVYCASDLNVMNNSAGGDFFFSNPNVRIVLPEDVDDVSDKAVSNPDLQAGKQFSPTTEVDMNLPYNIVTDIPKLDFSGLPLDESGYASEIHVSVPSEIESPDSDSSKDSSLKLQKYDKNSGGISDTKKINRERMVLENIEEYDSVSKSSARKKDPEMHIEIIASEKEELGEVIVVGSENVAKKTRQSGVKKSTSGSDTNIEIIERDSWELGEVTVEKTNSKKEISKTQRKLKTDGNSKKSDDDSSSRPETPTWDYYDMPAEVVTQEVERSKSPWKEGAAPVILPMETTMGLAGSKPSAIAQPVKKDRSVRRSKKKTTSAIPGKALPLVPQIVVTNAEYDVNQVSSPKQAETTVDMPQESAEASKNTKSFLESKEDHDIASTHIEIKTYADTGARPKTKSLLKKIDRKQLVNVGKAVNKSKDSGSKTNNIKESEQGVPEIKPWQKKLRKPRDPVDTASKTDLSTKQAVVPPLRLDKLERSPMLTSGLNQKPSDNKIEKRGSERPGSSVVVDMDKITRSVSGAHVVELIEDDISITELTGDELLFTDRSEVSLGGFTDAESGLSDYKLPEHGSPTKYMIPMQVYDVDDTSCDESVSAYKPYIHVPTTEL